MRRDLAAALIEVFTVTGKRSITIASAYFSGDGNLPPKEIKRLIY